MERRYSSRLFCSFIVAIISLVASAATPEQELLNAIAKDDIETVSRLLKNGAPHTFENAETGTTPLMMAVGQLNVELIKTLTRHGAKADSRNAHGDTPLHVAAYMALKPVWEVLIISKPNLDITNASGATPLMVAAIIGNVDAVKLLINAKAKINVQMPDRSTTLLLAAKGGAEVEREKERREVVLRLLKAGADPNHRNREKRNALYYAVVNEDEKMVQTLIENGAKITKDAAEDKETWEIAKSSEDNRILKHLEAASQRR